MAGLNLSRTSLAVLATLCAAPFAYLCYVAARYAVDLPVQDEWVMVPLIHGSLTGDFSLAQLFAQHNEHRVPFTKLLLLVSARLTDWDTRYEAGVNVVLGGAFFVLVAGHVVRTARRLEARALLWYLPVVSLLVFSLAQYVTWFHGWQNQVLLNILGITGACFLLARPALGIRGVVAAAALTFVASFSFANGFLFWPIGILVLGVRAYRGPRNQIAHVGIWALAAAVTGAVYFYNFEFARVGGAVDWDVAWAWRAVLYVVAFIGGAVSASGERAPIVAGVLGLGLAAGLAVHLCRARRDLWVHAAPYALVALYGTASGALTAAGRVQLGVGQATASRYTTIGNLFWIGTLVILGLALHTAASGRAPASRTRIWRRAVAVCVLGAVSVPIVWSDRLKTEVVEREFYLLSAYAWKLRNGLGGSYLETIYPDGPAFARLRRIAREHELSVYRDDVPAPRLFALDTPDYRTLKERRTDHSGRRYMSRATDARIAAWRKRREGQTLVESGDYEQAEAAFRASLELDPGNPRTLTALGTLLVKQARTAEAEPLLVRALEWMPRDTQALTNLGVVSLMKGNWAEASDRLARAVELEPSDPVARLNLGLAEYQLGNLDAATDHAEAVLRADPANEKAARFLKMLAADTQTPPEP